MRQRFFQDLETLAAGGEPKAIVRDAAVNRRIELPIVGRRHFIEGLTREQMARERPGIAPRREFPFLVGQPESVRRAYDEAMGFAD
jgi:5,5'-dehydrodivanillate O-demethylase